MLALWLSIALYVFAAVFFIVGVSRVVEFSNIGIKESIRRFLIAAHVTGCALFSAVFVAYGMNSGRSDERMLIAALLGGALVILFPVHIYVGVKRRIAIKDKSKNPQ